MTIQLSEPKYLKRFSKKNKLVSWIVSDCKTPSKRENLVKSLQKFIPVDIFGKCGNLTCFTKSISKSVECLNDYKFYLSFEHTLCPDYVTEKLYKLLFSLIIPVVYNGADMKRFMPPHSFIDANDFETVEDLANYLKFVAESPEEFLSYFWWRRDYKMFKWYSNDFNKVCARVEQRIKTKKKNTYEDIKGWFNENCTEPRIKF